MKNETSNKKTQKENTVVVIKTKKGIPTVIKINGRRYVYDPKNK